jgi:hypothetical protein
LGFDQPVQSFSGGKLNALGTAFSAIYRLDRLLPARSSRQFKREHPSPRTPRQAYLPVKHISNRASDTPVKGCYIETETLQLARRSVDGVGQSRMESRCRQETGAARPSRSRWKRPVLSCHLTRSPMPLRCYAGGQWFPSPSAASAPARRGRSWSDPAEVVGRYRTGVGGQVRTGVVGTGDVELDRSARNASSRSKNRPRMACGMLR